MTDQPQEYEEGRVLGMSLLLEGTFNFRGLVERLSSIRELVQVGCMRVNESGAYRTRFQVLVDTTSVDEEVGEFSRAVDGLPQAASNEWRSLRLREFDIAVRACPKYFEVSLQKATSDTIARLGGQIRISVYPPEFKDNRTYEDIALLANRRGPAHDGDR